MEIDATSARQGRKGTRTLKILGISIALLVVSYFIYVIFAGDASTVNDVSTSLFGPDLVKLS